jgi:hypothetical protein
LDAGWDSAAADLLADMGFDVTNSDMNLKPPLREIRAGKNEKAILNSYRPTDIKNILMLFSRDRQWKTSPKNINSEMINI